MGSNEPAVNLTYEELLEQTKKVLDIFKTTGNPVPDDFDRGMRYGAIQHWYKLAMSTTATEKQCQDDYNQLRHLAGLSNNDFQ